MLDDGSRDLEQAIAELAARLPPPIAALGRVAFDYGWSWTRGGPDLFRSLDPERWQRAGENPVRLLRELPPATLARAASDETLVSAARALDDELATARARPASLGLSDERPVAFFCSEYAIHVSLPIYSGGLGALAGDVLKEAADLALPMVAVGLYYRHGYFHQRLDRTGWQHEYWLQTQAEDLPCVRVTRSDGRPLVVTAPFFGRQVRAYVRRVDVGRVRLFLLDSDHPENSRVDRWLCSRLYVGDRQLRLGQYLLLGVGGVRALAAMGIEPSVVHMNEGHAALAPLERIRARLRGGASWEEAFAAVRASTVFTTHTPVAAGNDEYSADEATSALSGFLQQLEPERDQVLSLARPRPESNAFGVTPLALRESRAANGVSRRHGHVARRMWQSLYPGRPAEAVPIAHVTNGVHLPTWMAPALRRLLDRFFGPSWEERLQDPAVWARLDDVPDAELWAVRCELRAELVEYARSRSAEDRLARGDNLDYVEAAARTFDPGVLTIGFARRLATYKRLHLLTYDPTRALRLLSGDRPVQILIAGKAHPQDEEAKRIVQQHLFPLRSVPEVARRVCYLEDYDLAMALPLVRGCDVWVNAPRPPLEASGTSGMKAAFNGGLNLSVLDGWWEEGFDGSNGWGIGGDESADTAAQDARDATSFYDLLEQEVVPLFYQRDEHGVPLAWVRKLKQSLRSLGPRFNTRRMMTEYAGIYRGA